MCFTIKADALESRSLIEQSRIEIFPVNRRSREKVVLSSALMTTTKHGVKTTALPRLVNGGVACFGYEKENGTLAAAQELRIIIIERILLFQRIRTYSIK